MFRRLAFLAAAILVAGCSTDSTTAVMTPPPPAAPSEQVTLAFDSVTMRAGDSIVPVIHVIIGDTARLALPGEVDVTSSDTAVIAVASNTALLGLTDGASTITAMWHGDTAIHAAESVAVRSEALTNVNLVAPLAMVPGDTATFVVTGTTRFGREVTAPASVTVTSRDPSIVAATGNLAIAVAAGTTWIVATASTGAADSSFVTVAIGAPVSLTLSPHTTSLSVGGTLSVTVQMLDRRGNPVTAVTPAYLSRAVGVASVSSGGVVTATGAGSTWIVAQSGAAADSLHVTVIDNTPPPVTLGSLRSTPAAITLAPGDSARVTVAAFDTHGNPMTTPALQWISNAVGITVTSSGMIHAASTITQSITNAIVTAMSGSVTTSTAVNVVVAPPPSGGTDTGYVQIVWVGNAPESSVAAAFEAARQRINGLFKSFNGVTPVNPNIPAGYCETGAPALNQTVKGIVIYAQVAPIDGVGNILGSAGPCLERSGTLLPVVGTMQFDSADMDAMVANGTLNGVVLHEMMHTLGFGTIWGPGQQDEVAQPNGADPRYTGATGTSEYAALGATDAASGVPVENTGGTGTRGAHWRESVFNGELMTGWANGHMAMSRVTIGALKDFGYDVDLGKADPYTLGAALRADQIVPEQQLGETLRHPIGIVTPGGTVTPVQ